MSSYAQYLPWNRDINISAPISGTNANTCKVQGTDITVPSEGCALAPH